MGSTRLTKKEKPLGPVHIPYVKGVSKCSNIWKICNIRTIFKTEHKLKSTLMKTRPEKDPRQTAQCVYSISCESGRSCVGETHRPLAVQLREQRHIKKDLLEKSG
jgi:hypothetical protein